MKKSSVEKQLKRILSDLDNVTNRLEEVGFCGHQRRLDKAADLIEETREAFENL